MQGRDLRGNISLLGVRAPSRGALEAHWGQGAAEEKIDNLATFKMLTLIYFIILTSTPSIQPEDLVHAQNKDV